MSDNDILSDAEKSISKTRDFATVTGFLIIFIFSSIVVACQIKELTLDVVIGENRLLLFSILFLVLVFAAGVLAWTKKRFVCAATFILYGYSILAPILPTSIFKDTVITTEPIGIAMIVFAIALVTACRKSEIINVLILLVSGVALFLLGFSEDVDLKWVIVGLETAVAIMAALCVACFVVRNPNDKVYRFFNDADEDARDFWESGTAVGLIVMSMSMIASSMYYLHIGHITTNEMAALETAAGVTLILISIMMTMTTHSRFAPFLLLMIGVTFTLTSFVTEIGQVLCVFTLLIGIICFLRNDGKNMIGAAIIIYGFSYLISAQWVTADYQNDALSSVLNIVPMLLLFYLVFAFYSKKQLPIA